LIFALIEFFVSATVIIVGGTFLTRAADRLAELTGLGRVLDLGWRAFARTVI